MCRARIALLVVAAALLAVPAFAQKPKGEKYALLVGVRKYDPNELRSLEYAEADIVALAEVLKANGYRPDNVVLLTQAAATQDLRFLPVAERIRKELALLVEDCTPEDSVLVALAGHGVQFRGESESYFCPADARLADKSTLIALGETYKALEQCPAGFKILLVDACRNDPASKVARSREKVELESVTRPQRTEPPGGVAALFSCSAGEEAFENDALKHGVFFNFIIEGLSGAATDDGSEGVTLPELELFVKKRVRDFVRAQYGVRQMPELKGTSRGLVPLITFDRAALADKRGLALMDKGEMDQAMAAFDEALRLNPEFGRAYFDRGRLRLKIHDDNGAVDDFNAAIRRRFLDASVYTARARAYNVTNQSDWAFADCTEAIRLDPKYAPAYSVRGGAYGRKGDYDREIADCTEAIRLDPKYVMAYVNRGFAYEKKGDYDREIADCTEAIRLDPKIAMAYNNRGVAYGRKGDYDREIADCTEAIRLDPKLALAYVNRGFAYEKKGDYDREIADCTEAIRLDPKLAKAYGNRGFAYGRKGDYDREIADCTEAIRLDPKLAKAYGNRGFAYGRKGDYDRAIADCTEAISLDPKLALAYVNRGFAYGRKGDYDRAIADCTEAIRLDPKLAAKAYIIRGFAYGRKGDTARANADRARALQLDTDIEKK